MKTGYINGSDLLVKIAGNYVASSTSFSLSMSSETKDHAVKPLGSQPITTGKYKGKSVTGLSLSVNAEGLRVWDESENGYKTLVAAWKSAKSVEVEFVERAAAAAGTVEPWLKGKFVITSLEQSAPAEDDATYSVSLENDGEPEVFDPSRLTGENLETE